MLLVPAMIKVRDFRSLSLLCLLKWYSSLAVMADQTKHDGTRAGRTSNRVVVSPEKNQRSIDRETIYTSDEMREKIRVVSILTDLMVR